MVRISLGAYNTAEDLDALVEMLVRIAEGGYAGPIGRCRRAGDYVPVLTHMRPA